MFESILVIMIYVAGVFTPVLIPVTIHAVHAVRAVRGWRHAFTPGLAAHLPRPVV